MTVTIPRKWLAAAGAVLLAVIASLVLAACAHNNGNPAAQSDVATSNNIESQYLKDQPIPDFNGHSDIQALGEQTTSFMFNQGVQKPVAYCPSEGLPVAADSQLSNPDTIFDDYNVQNGGGNGGQSDVIANMDPNGIYPGVSSGTYALCVDQSGGTYAFYWEGYDASVSAPATWNNSTNSIQVTGAPTMPSCTVTNAGKASAKATCTK
jgi:hypothetical protein